MAFSFRKSKKIFPGVRLGLTTKGLGISGGVKGARISMSATGKTTFSAGVPGSGVRYRKSLTAKESAQPSGAESTLSHNVINSTAEERWIVLRWFVAAILSGIIAGFTAGKIQLMSISFLIATMLFLILYVRSSRKFKMLLIERNTSADNG